MFDRLECPMRVEIAVIPAVVVLKPNDWKTIPAVTKQ